MSVTDIPFDSDQINDPNTLRAIIEIDRGPRPEAASFAPPQWAGAYGAVLWGQGDVLRLWGAGCAKSDDILRAFAVARLLECRQGDAKLIVHSKGLEGILGHVSVSKGFKAGGKTPFEGFGFLKPIQDARGRGEWGLVPVKARVGEPEGYHLAVRESKSGLRVALKMLPVISTIAAKHCDPLNFIEATDADPNPDGLMGHLEAARG
ncbi:hypothetical protein EJ074_11830 [Mesorhizobium sp. M3A.F.Ca.ET.080.04.2.1]|uniref:hypothetical protein n=1 Tax=Mesorhizobium sp. M3A.F.Ca.ET.080.04.2.1 TaxID=2493676 RepID=UPI000F7646CD|nr:hypothetical protein [Mesorhizobium sp. M3A.F.Ca.ET.080.04.2.1]AZO09714.1 hypothetical protein EJ074_11830 [Mesorhizobium sp. M3A.F.Ca.ET.080.04.2.1]RWF24303.1 MAG: hypothetical protein EOS64_08210 [Mesorhizobium sp.]TGT57718.1 hypothetical protein EN813_037485 [Mesorhizobium sp. M00.F.Ca.ET.170.01.1.1]